MSEWKLPGSLAWSGEHASDVALTAMADGQESILDESVRAHVDACEACCARKLGEAALLSAAIGQAVRRERAWAAHAPSPWRALVSGVVVAIVAALPLVPDARRIAAYAAAFVTHGLPVLARSGASIATSEPVARALPVATVVASALLWVAGVAVARLQSRQDRSGS